MEFHWIITIEVQHPNGIGSVFRDGIITVRPGVTRQKALKDILSYVTKDPNVMGKAFVIKFFSMEPNELTAV